MTDALSEYVPTMKSRDTNPELADPERYISSYEKIKYNREFVPSNKSVSL
jgi:hypothetical protein